MIEENLAVEIGFGETVGARIEFLVIARRLEAKRIEFGVKVAAHAVGADQHQGADRIARRLMHVGGTRIGAFGLRLGGDLAANHLLDFGPVAVERRGEVVARAERPVGPLPGRPVGILQNVRGRVLQALEELLPFGIDRGGVLLVAGVEFVDVGGVGALQEGGEGKCGIRVLARHDCVLMIGVCLAKIGRNDRSGTGLARWES